MLKNKPAFTEENGNLSSYMLSNIPTPILVTNLDYSIRYVNSSLEKITGFSSSELIGRKLPYPWWPKEQRDKLRRTFQKYVKSGGNNRQHCFQKKNGEYFWVQIKGSPIRKGQKLKYYISTWIDITQQKNTDEMLEAERFKLKEYFENLPLLAYNVGLDGKIVDCNKNVLTTLGYKSKKELIGKPLITTIYAPSSRKKAKQLFTKWMKTGKIKDEELQVITEKGKILDVSLNVDTIYDVKGKPLYNISTQKDITEHKQNENKIQENTSLNRILIDTMPCVAMLLKPHSREIVMSNSAAMKVGAVTGKTCFSTWIKRTTPCPWCLAPKVWTNGEAQHLEIECQGMILDAYWIPITEDLYMHYAFDITEHKKAEKKLEESEKKFRGLVEPAGAPISIVDLKGRFNYVNKAFLDVMDFTSKELLGQSFKDLLHPDDKKKVMWLFLNIMLLKRQPRSLEFRALRKDGQIVHFITKPSRYEVKGKTVGFQAILTDITEHKKSEENMNRLAKFLSENPSPVLRLNRDGTLLYANEASKPFLKDWGCEVGGSVPRFWHKQVSEVLSSKTSKTIDVELGEQVYSFFITPIEEQGYINLYGREITERKKIEYRLIESEERFRNIAERSIDIIYIVDLKGRVKYISPRVEAVVGYKPEEIINKSFIKFLPKSEIPKATVTFARSLIGKERPALFESKVKRKDGCLVAVEVNASPIIKNNRISGFQGIIRDITERKKTEEEVRKLAKFPSENPSPVLRLNRDGTLLYANEASKPFLKDWGCEVGGSVPRFWHKQVSEVLSSKTSKRIEIELGEQVYSFFITPIPEHDYVNLYGRDITYRKLAEKKLKHYSEHLEELVEKKSWEVTNSERFLRSTIENVQDYMYLKDRDLKYILVNGALCKFLGKEKEEILNKTAYDFYDKEKADLLTREDEKVFETGSPIHTDNVSLTDAHGSTHILHSIKTPMKDLKGNVTHLIGLARDVTERKSLEKMKEQFISAATHELRTPLVSIKGYTDLLLSPETKLSDDVQSDLKIVRQNADRLISLTDDLLDIRRMEAGKLKLNTQKLDLLEVVERCMNEIKPFIKSKQNIELKIDNPPLLIQADRLRIFQIVMNLLVNATKFTPDDGKITVNLREKEDAVELQVSDTGIGIKKENLQRIFEPFANIEKPTYIEGTGLGLSVTKGLVEQHGGKISVTSPGEEKGATFTILLLKADTR